MTTEQREAIEFLEFYKQHCLKKEIENMDNYETIHDGDFVSKNLDTVLSLIKEQEEEIERLKTDNGNVWQLNANMSKRHLEDICKLKQKDKQIDLMAKFIENNMSEKKIINEICIKSKCNNEECHEDDLKDCIKQYFARKVEDVKG